MQQRAVFLDRDGTLVHPRHYPSRPEELCLYDDIDGGLRNLQVADWLLVVITNQAGLARAKFSVTDLDRMHIYLRAEFARRGVHIDAIYHCPHHPQGVVPELTMSCDCRKPQPGMLLQAATDLNICLEHSWFVGDILDDVEAGRRAGCRTVLVDLGSENQPASELRWPHYIAHNTSHALAIIAAVEGAGPEVELDYLPSHWVPIEQRVLS